MNSTLTAPTIEKFARLVSAGIEAWTEAGRVLVALLDEDDKNRVRIMDKIPWMTTTVLCGFERIGRGEIFPCLLLDKSPGAHALIALPYAEQERLHNAEIAVASFRKGEIITFHRSLQNLTERECDLVFSDTGVRSIAEQSKILLARNRPSNTTARTPRYPEPIERRDDEPAVEQSLDDDEEDTAEKHLARAQSELIRVREIMAAKGPNPLDRFITQALTAIGNLRFQLKEQR